MNKGGCKIGKKSDLGGCKIGKKNPKPEIKITTFKKKPKFKVKPAVVAPVKKKPKFKVKAPAPAPVKKKPKFKVKAPAPKKPTPKEVSEAKLPKIKKGEIQTELMGQFGLTNKQANSMSALKLFGLLSPEVKKIILDPKTTGTKVGRISASKLGYDELVFDNPKMYDDMDEQTNFFDAMAYNYTRTVGGETEVMGWNQVLPKAQARFYGKYYDRYSQNELDEDELKISDRMDELGQKVMDKVSNIVFSDRNKAVRAWKKKNKGLTGTLLELQEAFADFYTSNYY